MTMIAFVIITIGFLFSVLYNDSHNNPYTL